MAKAIEFDRPEFVSFLLKGPIELNKFVGEGNLSELYEKVLLWHNYGFLNFQNNIFLGFS